MSPRSSPSSTVRDIALPPDARSLATLPRVDYTDSFLLEAEGVEDHTSEQWARALLEGAPASTRAKLRRGWFMLGVRLGSVDDPGRVLGWEIRRSSPDLVLLAARSIVGMDAEVLCKREPRGLLVATFLRLRNPVARALWAVIAPHHRRVVRHLLRRLSSRFHGQRLASSAT